MRKLMGLLLAALLMTQPALPVRAAETIAEETVGRLDLPVFDPALWPAPRPIDSLEDAKAYAMEILQSELLRVDVSNADWDAQWIDAEETFDAYVQHRSCCLVHCVLSADETLTLVLYADNGGVRVLFGPRVGTDFTRWVNVPPDPDDPWRESLWQYALALLETMEPGVTESFQSVRDGGDFLIDGVRFVQLEFVIDDNYSKEFRLQVFPEIRLLEAYTGLG